MFYFSFTRTPIEYRFPSDCKITSIATETLFVVIHTDDVNTRLEQHDGGFEILEDILPVSEASFQKSRLINISYSRMKRAMSISLPLNSPRPIFYHLNESGEFFCSTHISLLRTAGVPISENTSVVPEYFLYRYVTAPHTLFKNIYTLHHGETLTLNILPEGCSIGATRNSFPFDPSPNYLPGTSTESAIADVLAELTDTFSGFKPMRETVAIPLSGGLDSSILYSLARNILNTSQSYSTAYPFEDPGKDKERHYARSAASAIGGNHVAYESTNEAYLEAFLEAIASAEEPLSHLQSVMYYLLEKEALSDNEKIIMFGQGADTFFGIEYHTALYRALQQPEIYERLRWNPAQFLLNQFVTRTGRAGAILARVKALDKINIPLEDPGHYLYSIALYGGDIDWVCRHFSVSKTSILENRYALIKQFAHYPIFDLISIIAMFSDIPNTIHTMSKHAESLGKTAFFPFLTPDLMKTVFAIPWDLKLQQPKHILRAVAYRLDIPEFIITRRKAGFGILSKQWAEKNGLFEPIVSMTKHHFDPAVLRKLQQPDQRNSMMFWRVLNYVLWKRLVIDQEPIAQLKEELFAHL